MVTMESKTILVEGKDIQYKKVINAHTKFTLSWANRLRALCGKEIIVYCYIYSNADDPMITGAWSPGHKIARIFPRKNKSKTETTK